MGNHLLCRPSVDKQATGWYTTFKLLSIFLLLFFTSFIVKAQFTTAGIDGNPQEWSKTNIFSVPIHAYQLDPYGTGVVDDQFTSSKDFFLLDGTGQGYNTWADGQTKSKNDIANAAAVLVGTNLFFAGDRTSNSGDAQIGFWFYLNGSHKRTLSTSPKNSGDFTPAHAIGDLLILANFTGGGRNGVVNVFKWVGSGGNAVGTGGVMDSIGVFGIVAENNDQSYNIPDGWQFGSTTYATNEFYEGYVDLSDPKLNISDYCFASFLLEARASQSITASLDDFVGGSFSAKPSVTVQGTNPNCYGGTGTITVTSSTAGLTFSLDGGGFAAYPSGGWTGLGAGQHCVVAKNATNCTSDPACATITIPPALIASDGHTDVQCNGGSDGSVTVTFSGGTGPYQVDFNGGGFAAQTSPKAYTGLAAGTYTWTVKDANGCTSSGSETVGQPTALTASDGHTDVQCNGGSDGSVTVTFSGGTGPYQIDFNGGGFAAQTSPKAYTGLAAGTYTWTVKDAHGCTTSGSETVGQPTVLTASDGHTDVQCNGGSDGSVTVTFSGGTGPYQVDFNGGGFAAQTSPKTYTGLAAGTYTWTVKDAHGCTTSGSETVGQPTALTASDSHVDATCSGNADGSVTVTFSGGTGPYQVDFNGGGFAAQTSPKTYTGLAAGTYTWTVKDAHGCTTSGSETVGQPSTLTASDGHTDVQCNGGSDGSVKVTFSGGTGPYQVDFNGGGFATQTSPKTYTGLAAGTYTWTVKDAHGCTTSGSETVGQPTVLTASDGHTDVQCNGGSDGSVTVTFSGGTGPYQVDFNGGGFAAQTSPKIYTGLAAGTYNWTVKDAHGCTTSGSETVGQPDPLSIDCGTIVQPSCFGAANGIITATFSGGTAPYMVSVDGSPFAPAASPYDATNLGGGEHTITVKDANGCTIDCKNTLNPPPQILIADPTVDPETCAGANDGCVTVVISGGAAPYTVTLNGDAMTDQGDGVTFKKCGLAPGTYTIDVNDANKCVETSTNVEVPAGQPCGGPHCTYTQGQYGTYNGQACLPDGSSVLAGKIMYDALNAEPDKYKDFGSATKYFRLYLSDVTGGSGANIYKMLPGGGGACALKGAASYSNTASWGNVPLSTKSTTYGKILNTLLAQTITMYFNLYMDPKLGDVTVEDTIITSKQTTCGSGIAVDGTGQKFGFPHDVVVFLNNTSDAYNYPNTVSGLFQLANDILGGANIPVDCSHVGAAVDTYNNAYDGCRIQTGSIPYVDPSSLLTASSLATRNSNVSIQQPKASITDAIQVKAYPNPYRDRITFNFVSPVSGQAQLEIFNIAGQRVAVPFSGMVKAGVNNTVNYAANRASGMLIYKLSVDGKSVRGKVQQIQ